jgi:ABC-type transporter Mla MlaB component
MPADNQSGTKLSFSGEMTIQTIEAAYRSLSEKFRSDDSVVIDVSEVGDADLTFVQLIEAARRTAAAQSKTLALAAPASGALLAVLERGGFLPEGDGKAATFWLHNGGVV